ncbi:pentapeptide repeat-containing protein [Actinocrinis puniceicyclus]|uniref:Pentapeptide repeat-containing protein n=1 Tax=Actinocrinis puniceicyclus TaxID=977794 RepID=A0A8J8BEW2_9ACTN|nr:pentapeptide repeat-containing protein [Actinocrinis puniceicyclus]MBS2966803.1 pentapeptide repeat-containing protein [Actinocrinis puniceicyclus]
MDQLVIRRTSADLPVFDSDMELQSVSTLGTDTGPISDFEFGDTSVRTLDLENVTLLHGRICGVKAARANIEAVRMDSIEFTGCDFSSLNWQGGKLSRVRFETCKLLGSQFHGVTLENVVFVGCKLDYSTVRDVRATGPVLFVRCSLPEVEFTGCDLSGALFNDCNLQLTSFGSGTYRDCDLRGNDLSALTGSANLKNVIIERTQTTQLGEALAAELNASFGDDMDERQDPDQGAWL